MEKVKAIVSKVLDVETDQVGEETPFEEFPTWNSFKGLLLLSKIEEEFNIKFSMKEAAANRCVKDIKEGLERHGVSLADE